MPAVALDGPVAAGKSVVGRRLAQELGWLFLDTGAMYRAVTWLVLQRGVDPTNEAAVAALAREARLTISEATVADGRPYTVLADGEDVTWAIRSPEVESLVSEVSRNPGVRAAMVARQREIALRQPVVMVGRDIGTVVLPRAPVKVFLTASVEARARRRCQELEQRGQSADSEAVLEEMRARDRIDSERAHSPLKPAREARVIDSSEMAVEEVVGAIKALLAEAGCISSTTSAY